MAYCWQCCAPALGAWVCIGCDGIRGGTLHECPWRGCPIDGRPRGLKRTSPLATPELVDVFLENTNALGWTGPGAKTAAMRRFPCPVVGCSGMYGARKRAFCFKCTEPGPGAWTCIGCDGIRGGTLDECPWRGCPVDGRPLGLKSNSPPASKASVDVFNRLTAW